MFDVAFLAPRKTVTILMVDRMGIEPIDSDLARITRNPITQPKYAMLGATPSRLHHYPSYFLRVKHN